MSRLALLLDMDGVLVHSNPLHREAWIAYNRRFGIEMTEAMHQRMYGRRNDEIVRDFFGGHLSAAEVFEHGAAKERLYREMLNGSVEGHLVPGVRAFLDTWKGVPKGVATNAEPANVDFVLDHAALRPYFSAVLDGSRVARPKPDPEIYLRLAESLGAQPADCVVFEDSHTGIAAARAAGMRVVGVRTTHRELPGVDLAIDDFRDAGLTPWLVSLRS